MAISKYVLYEVDTQPLLVYISNDEFSMLTISKYILYEVDTQPSVVCIFKVRLADWPSVRCILCGEFDQYCFYSAGRIYLCQRWMVSDL